MATSVVYRRARRGAVRACSALAPRSSSVAGLSRGAFAVVGTLQSPPSFVRQEDFSFVRQGDFSDFSTQGGDGS